MIAVSLNYSFQSISKFLVFGHSVAIFDLKRLGGSQQYGFVLCFGFFVAMFGETLFLERWLFPQRVIIYAGIMLGMVFTFPRATIVSVIGSFVIVGVLSLMRKMRNAPRRAATSAPRKKVSRSTSSAPSR